MHLVRANHKLIKTVVIPDISLHSLAVQPLLVLIQKWSLNSWRRARNLINLLKLHEMKWCNYKFYRWCLVFRRRVSRLLQEQTIMFPGGSQNRGDTYQLIANSCERAVRSSLYSRWGGKLALMNCYRQIETISVFIGDQLQRHVAACRRHHADMTSRWCFHGDRKTITGRVNCFCNCFLA